MPTVKGIERVPGDEHGTGLLFAVEAQQQVGKAKYGACRLAAAPQNRFRQGVVRAIGEHLPSITSKRLAL